MKPTVKTENAARQNDPPQAKAPEECYRAKVRGVHEWGYGNMPSNENKLSGR
jgi:hypothetical protein